MTGPLSDARLPGRLLLTLARVVLGEPALSTVITPAIADLQQEVLEAGASRTGRLRARARGYVALAKLMVMAPFLVAGSPDSGPFVTLMSGRSGGSAVVLLVPILCVAIWPMFGSFVTAATISGLLLAIILRWWHTRYPSSLAPADPMASRPAAEINLSSIPVAGDIGGLIFVVGSFVILLLGLPDLRWFVSMAMVAATVLAGGLFAWRSSHPSSASATNSILTR
ncbi:MAG TPA: hypothetical protein VI485_25955 [Vicinamibacterales bacterium]|nr:hypothetical protein [Vicinamibacterales bacterium]